MKKLFFVMLLFTTLLLWAYGGEQTCANYGYFYYHSTGDERFESFADETNKYYPIGNPCIVTPVLAGQHRLCPNIAQRAHNMTKKKIFVTQSWKLQRSQCYGLDANQVRKNFNKSKMRKQSADLSILSHICFIISIFPRHIEKTMCFSPDIYSKTNLSCSKQIPLYNVRANYENNSKLLAGDMDGVSLFDLSYNNNVLQADFAYTLISSTNDLLTMKLIGSTLYLVYDNSIIEVYDIENTTNPSLIASGSLFCTNPKLRSSNSDMFISCDVVEKDQHHSTVT